MSKFIVSIGSNSSDREWQISHAVEWLKEKFRDIKQSSVYETRALDGSDVKYLNTVVRASTSKDAEEVVAMTKQYEVICGRTPASREQGIVPVDIDVVVWNDEIVRKEEFGYPYFSRGYYELLSKGEVKELQ